MGQVSSFSSFVSSGSPAVCVSTSASTSNSAAGVSPPVLCIIVSSNTFTVGSNNSSGTSVSTSTSTTVSSSFFPASDGKMKFITLFSLIILSSCVEKSKPLLETSRGYNGLKSESISSSLLLCDVFTTLFIKVSFKFFMDVNMVENIVIMYSIYENNNIYYYYYKYYFYCESDIFVGLYIKNERPT